MDIYQLRNIFSLSYTNYTHYNPFCLFFLNYTGLRMASTVLVCNGLKFRVTHCDCGFPVLAIFQATLSRAAFVPHLSWFSEKERRKTWPLTLLCIGWSRLVFQGGVWKTGVVRCPSTGTRANVATLLSSLGLHLLLSLRFLEVDGSEGSDHPLVICYIAIEHGHL